MDESATDPLLQLAHLYGIETEYYDICGDLQRASPEALLAVLRSLGAPVASQEDAPAAIRERQMAEWRRLVEPVAVAWDGGPLRLEVRLPSAMANAPLVGHLALETGEQEQWQWSGADLPATGSAEVDGAQFVAKQLTFPKQLSLGYHRFTLEASGQSAHCLIISAPRSARTPQPDSEDSALRQAQDSAWGVFLPLYALHSRRSWGSGDFSAMQAFIEWLAGMGGRVAGTLPLLAAFLDEPFQPSPYLAASRLLWNELYIDVTRVPELQVCPPAQALMESSSFQDELAAVRSLPLVDYRRQMALKRRVLEELAKCCFQGGPDRLRRLQDFARSHPVVEDYARFRATGQRQQRTWPLWPQPLRDGAVTEPDYDEETRRYHLYVQWLAQQQVESLCQAARDKGVRLYLDLPLGVHYDGYDMWRNQGLFAGGVSAGAPPDDFFVRGQNWAIPPMHPEALRQQGYSYYIACLQHHLRHAGMLRIDHVMGCHHLFWVPGGMEPKRGVYVRYRPEEFYAILCLESHRNDAIIVGEDLGTVPAEVRPAMEEHGLQRMYVAQFELTPDPKAALPEAPRHSLACVNTHDTPTFAGFWEGIDLKYRQEMGLLDEPGAQQERQRRQALKEALVSFLQSKGYTQPSASDLQAVLRGVFSIMAAGAAPFVLVNLEDLWLETKPQNVPGTHDEHPNWRRKARYTFEELSQLPQVVDMLREIDDARKRG